MSGSWRELALKYYEKSRVLRKEFTIDLKYGAYNKAVSSAYFMVEALANAIFALKKHKTRGFSGRAALVRELFGIELFKDLLKLHELREKADHREVILGKDEAHQAYELANKLYQVLKKSLKNLINKT